MAVIILVVASWLNYRQHFRPKLWLKLAMGGLNGGSLHAAAVFMESPSPSGGGLSGVRVEPAVEADVRDVAVEQRAGEPATVEMESGSDKIYRGILWMKEKYEQYREQADSRYEQLKAELGRAEQRYQELVGAMQHGMDKSLGTVTAKRSDLGIAGVATEMTAGEGEYIAETAGEGSADDGDIPGEFGNGSRLVTESGAAVLQSELRAERLKVEELEKELRTERMKVEELVVKLQSNSEMLMNIYQELDKSLPSHQETH